ncbi:MAG: serine hydrolase [Lachnospiraceae bacterium]|nr:serine hydrolase [Lachnospiraceae bacterium]
MSGNQYNEGIFDAAEEEQRREEKRHQQRRERAERMRREKRRSMRIRRYGLFALLVISLLALVGIVVHKAWNKKDPRFIEPTQQSQEAVQADTQESSELQEVWSYEAHETDATATMPESVVSGNGILIDVESGEILAARGAHDRISPASMTKILTILVAAEQITPEQLDDKVTITIDITDYSFSNDCSNTGFEVDEQVTVRDLFYGTILPSGADSAVALATYVAGSHEAFVNLMNEKLTQMGLSDTTHFTNCVGLYDEDHYSTPYDMAVILKAATDNEWCREVLSTHVYTTSVTQEHPQGITISNWFLRRIEDKDTNGVVLCAKTGYVAQSGSCAASLAEDENGREYICVTAGSTSSWRCIYDQVDIYTAFLPNEQKEGS